MPERPVIPKPVQKPHPPIWVAVSSPETAIQAAERGIGCLGVSIGTPQEFQKRVEDYRRVIKNCEPVGEFVNDQVNGVTFLYVDETDEEARKLGHEARLHLRAPRGAPHRHQLRLSDRRLQDARPPLRRPQRRTEERAPGGGGAIREGMAIGSPETRDQEHQDVGGDRRRPHGVDHQHRRGHPAGAGPQVDAPLRRAGDAGVRSEATASAASLGAQNSSEAPMPV